MHLGLMLVLAAIAFSAPLSPVSDDLVPEVAFPIDKVPTPTQALNQNTGCQLPGPDDIPRDKRTTVACDGVMYDLSVPSTCGKDAAACGLIMDVHGAGMNGQAEEMGSGIARYGNQEGYIVIQPSSDDADWSSDPDGHGEWNEIESMEKFLRQVVNDFSSVIDAKKIHVAGFSQGAFVSWNLLCRASDLICSIAPTGFNNQGSFDRSILAKIGHKFSTHSNCWLDGSGPKTPRSIFYSQGKHDIFSSPASFKTSVDKVKKAYNLQGDGYRAGNGYKGVEWKWYTNKDVNIETVLFDYEARHADGKPLMMPFPPDPTGFKALSGHCFPTTKEGSAPNFPMGCGGPGAFIWGQEAVRFFKNNPCAPKTLKRFTHKTHSKSHHEAHAQAKA